MNIQSALNIIRVADAAIVSLPTFAKLIGDIKDALSSDSDQETLQAAYDDALQGAKDAHQAAQDAVRDHG